jgi:hypothetical protein
LLLCSRWVCYVSACVVLQAAACLAHSTAQHNTAQHGLSLVQQGAALLYGLQTTSPGCQAGSDKTAALLQYSTVIDPGQKLWLFSWLCGCVTHTTCQPWFSLRP